MFKRKNSALKEDSKTLNDNLSTAEALNQVIIQIPNVPHALFLQEIAEEDNEEILAKERFLNYMMEHYHIGS